MRKEHFFYPPLCQVFRLRFSLCLSLPRIILVCSYALYDQLPCGVGFLASEPVCVTRSFTFLAYTGRNQLSRSGSLCPVVAAGALSCLLCAVQRRRAAVVYAPALFLPGCLSVGAVPAYASRHGSCPAARSSCSSLTCRGSRPIH